MLATGMVSRQKPAKDNDELIEYDAQTLLHLTPPEAQTYHGEDQLAIDPTANHLRS